MKYPKWLVLLFALSCISVIVATISLIIMMIVALIINHPEYMVYIYIWNGLSWLGISFSIWKASQIER